MVTYKERQKSSEEQFNERFLWEWTVDLFHGDIPFQNLSKAAQYSENEVSSTPQQTNSKIFFKFSDD